MKIILDSFIYVYGIFSLLVILSLPFTATGCATFELNTQNTFTIFDSDNPQNSISCTVGLKTADGVVMNDKCVGHYEKGGNSYTCYLELSSDGKPLTEFFKVDQNCEIVISK